MQVIAGIDEAGRGALAGPVVAGACVISTPLFLRKSTLPRWSPFPKKCDEACLPDRQDCLIADSKLLSPEQREQSFGWITQHCFWGVGVVSQTVIDERGILFATNSAMLLAIEDLQSKTEIHELIVDGRDNFRFPLPHRSIIRGDQTEPAIAAGSIVAKVTRDRFMIEQSATYPLYGFAGHKGYGAATHLNAIREHGVCPLHRRSYLRGILENQALPLVIAAD